MTPEKIVREALTSPIYDLAAVTPLTLAERLSAQLGCKIYLKREDMQPIFSFKVRGAYHKLLKTPCEKRAAGIVAASAGNHAQGVAISARKLGIGAHIFMPRHTQQIKIDAVKSLGAQVNTSGEDLAAAMSLARAHAKRAKMEFFHPFDDYDIISGQGTVAAEILRMLREPADAIFVPTGGGGLLAGIATVVKSLRPAIKVVGVEPDDAASMGAALAQSKLVSLPYVGTFADTVAVQKVGRRTFGLCGKFVNAMMTVDRDSICAAIKHIYENTRVIAEPAGALGVAAARKWIAQGRGNGRPLVAVLSGANMNFDSLRYVLEGATAGEQDEMLLAAKIPEKPGSFLRFCEILGGRKIIEFTYRYSDVSDAHIFAGIEVASRDESAQILASLKDNNINAVDLTDDETTKHHVRYMVGGHARPGSVEHVYQLEIPERPDALMRFLKGLRSSWNISLFHYRYSGADYSRLLVGLQVAHKERGDLEKVFNKIGYKYWRKENSTSYKVFLSNSDPAGN